MKFKLLIILIFLSTSGIAQSNDSLPKNNSFSNETRDSILSKLLDRKANKKRLEIFRLSIRKYEDIIIDFEELDRQRALNEISYLEVISTKDSIIYNSGEILKIEKKKKVRRGLIWGGSGVIIGLIIKSFL